MITLTEWYEYVLLLAIVALFWANPLWVGILIALVAFVLELFIDNIASSYDRGLDVEVYLVLRHGAVHSESDLLLGTAVIFKGGVLDGDHCDFAAEITMDHALFRWRLWVQLQQLADARFDFSTFAGHSTLVPNDLNQATQAKLAHFAVIPPGFVLAVPYNSSTQTYEGGPQFNYRHFKYVTFFARPAFGALHENFSSTSTIPIPKRLSKGF